MNAKLWEPIDSSALSPRAVKQIGEAILNAEFPVVVTTYLGREQGAVKELITLCEAVGIAVVVNTRRLSLLIIILIANIGRSTISSELSTQSQPLYGYVRVTEKNNKF